MLIDKNGYFRLMRETSAAVNLQIDAYLQQCGYSGTLESVLRELPERRKRNPQLRPFLTRLTYQLCSDDDWKKIIPAIASMEFHNVYLYLHNWIFDNKNYVWNSKDSSRARVSELIIAASIFRELSEDALEEGIQFLDSSVQEDVRKEYRRSLRQNYLGFHQDLDLTIDKLTDFENDDEFIRIYKEKSRNLSGEAYGLTAAIGAVIGEGSPAQRQASLEFGLCLGTGLHIANDLGDFALPVEELGVFCKPYQDQLADIRDGRLTLPVYHTLRYGSKQEKTALEEMVGNYTPSFEQMQQAVKAVITSGAYECTMKVAREYYKRGKRILHEHFAESETRDDLSIMISSIRTNKFLVALKKLKEQNQ